MERIYDQLTSKISPVFTDKSLNSPKNHDEIKSFTKSGDRYHQTFSASGFSSLRAFGGGDNLSLLSQRDSKLGNNVCVIKPKHMMKELHRKTHFKAATGFLIGKEASLEYKQTERAAEVFTQIAKTFKIRREDRAKISSNKAGRIFQKLASQRNQTVSRDTDNNSPHSMRQGSPDRIFNQTFSSLKSNAPDSLADASKLAVRRSY